MDIKDEISDLYERWLLETYPDEIKNKDDLIEASCDWLHYDDFIVEVKRAL